MKHSVSRLGSAIGALAIGNPASARSSMAYRSGGAFARGLPRRRKDLLVAFALAASCALTARPASTQISAATDIAGFRLAMTKAQAKAHAMSEGGANLWYWEIVT